MKKKIQRKSIKTYTNALIFVVVILSFGATNLPQYSIAMFLTSLLALGCIVFIQIKFWRCSRCHRWLGLNLNTQECPRCGKRIDWEK